VAHAGLKGNPLSSAKPKFQLMWVTHNRPLLASR